MGSESISEVTIIRISRLQVVLVHFHHGAVQSLNIPELLDHGFQTKIYHLLLIRIDLFLKLQPIVIKVINTEQKPSPGIFLMSQSWL